MSKYRRKPDFCRPWFSKKAPPQGGRAVVSQTACKTTKIAVKTAVLPWGHIFNKLTTYMKIAIIGYGKMGKAIEEIALSEGHEIVLKISSQNSGEVNPSAFQSADVAIEFSRPESAFENVASCLRSGLPVVSGTTAWQDRLEEAKAICEEEKGAFFYASNFSIGVNIFFALSRHLASMMEKYPAYDVKMEETHHAQKLDYPSGTTIALANGVLENLSRKKNWSAVLKDGGAPPPFWDSDAIPIVSKREEGVPGQHLISWASGIDTIEISHTAHSRKGFAAGALQAASWLIGRQGFFGMEDMLGK